MEKFPEEVPLLVAQDGPLDGQRWALVSTTILGREPTCDIVIPDRQVSRHHARLRVTVEGIIVEDLGSKNGTHHNGQPSKEAILLQDGDILQIASAQKFIFLSSDATIPLEQGIELQVAPSTGTQNQEVGQMGRLRLDKRSRRVWIAIAPTEESKQEIEVLPPLSASQFRLLEKLYENQGRVVSRQDLVKAVWGEEQAYDVSEQALDALVRRLRTRISGVDASNVFVVTVRGHGLRLDNAPL